MKTFYFINNIFWQAALEIILIPIFSLINKDTNLHIFINVTSLYGLILLINEDSFIHTTYQKLIPFPLPRFVNTVGPKMFFQAFEAEKHFLVLKKR